VIGPVFGNPCNFVQGIFGDRGVADASAADHALAALQGKSMTRAWQ
jgi:hypothetical protein